MSKLEQYKNDIDKLLVDISLAGAVFGLADNVAIIGRYLATKPRSQCIVVLANSLAKIATKQYDVAIHYLNAIITNPELSKFHEEALSFKALALKLKGDKTGLQSIIPLVPKSFATALSE